MSEHGLQTEFAGLPVVTLPLLPDTTGGSAWHRDPSTPDRYALSAPERVAWRLGVPTWDEDWGTHLRRFLTTVDTTRVTALLIGTQGNDDSHQERSIRLLLEHSARFPALRHVFLADIADEEFHISWIRHDGKALELLLRTFPGLETLLVRGCVGSGFEPVRHTALRRLEIRSGGLGGDVVRAVGASTLPALEALELWLGVEDYGGDSTPADLADILSGRNLPALTRLGLMNSERQDEVAAAVAAAPVVARLRDLLLSMGTLGDEGAEALITGQPLTRLRTLDLSHHFIGPAMRERLTKALPGVDVRLDDPQEPEDADEEAGEPGWRYTQVSE